MTAAIVAETLAPIASEIEACLVTADRTHPQARVVLAIEPDGALHTVSVLPEALQPCVEPIVRTRSFPATRAAARQTITHVVRRR
jgi:hypothetical protein